MLNLGSYEGRQQLQADLVRFAELNDESFRDTLLTAKDPAKAFTEAVAVFNENVEEAEVARAKREQFKRDLYISDPEHAISVQARDDSAYLATILRGYIELFDPTPGPVEVLTWAGKRATTGVSRSSVMMAKATQEGDKLAGARIMHGADDLGEGVRHADDFMFPSADPSELARLDQLGRKGGAGMRDQRIAEQINREVTEDLRRAFPEQEGIEFAMSYRPKKDYDPIGSLPKPQAFGEKTLDPRSIQVLGAPESGLGKLVIFKPEHPLRTKGWDKLPAVQKRADLELYKLHLDQWTNFHKRNPAGKTGQWKQAIGERKKLDFGGGHSVEMELEAHKLAPNAIEIRAKHLSIDGTQIHKGRPASIGGDLDPLIAVDARTGKKLEGEMERFALESWNRRAVQAQKDFGFRSGGHGATAHGDDVTPRQWTSFAKYAAVHLTPAEQLRFEALVVKRAGLPAGTKILPAGLKADEHLLRTTISDSFVGPLGQVFD